MAAIFGGIAQALAGGMRGRRMAEETNRKRSLEEMLQVQANEDRTRQQGSRDLEDALTRAQTIKAQEPGAWVPKTEDERLRLEAAMNQPTQPPVPRNIDPNSPEGIAAAIAKSQGAYRAPQSPSSGPQPTAVDDPNDPTGRTKVFVRYDPATQSMVDVPGATKTAPAAGGGLGAGVALIRVKQMLPNMLVKSAEIEKLLEAGVRPTFMNAVGKQISQWGPVGADLGNRAVFTSPEQRQLRQAGDVVLTAILRPESGAAITQDEWTNYARIYLPLGGDDEGTKARKTADRARIGQAMSDAAEGDTTLLDSIKANIRAGLRPDQTSAGPGDAVTAPAASGGQGGSAAPTAAGGTQQVPVTQAVYNAMQADGINMAPYVVRP